MERWLPITGFENRYEISDRGRVRSIFFHGHPRRKPRIRKSHPCNGYQHILLFKDGRQHTRYVHSLLLEAFVGPRPSNCVACHNNGRKSDNRLSNLRWDSFLSNLIDDINHGKRARINPHIELSPKDEAAEIWRSCGIQNVEISNMGRFRHAISKVIKKPQYTPAGDEIRPTQKGTWSVSRLVAETFIGSRPTPKHRLIHLNHDRTDNRTSNLQYVTFSAFLHHRAAGPRPPKRRNAPAFKKRQISMLHRLLGKGWSYSKISRKLGCTVSAVSKRARGIVR